MPRTQNLLATVEGSTSNLALGGEVYQPCTWYHVIVDNVKHALLIGTNDAVFQFGVVVVALQLQKRFFTVLANIVRSESISFQRELVATLGQ